MNQLPFIFNSYLNEKSIYLYGSYTTVKIRHSFYIEAISDNIPVSMIMRFPL